jgi:hypothetical protein
MAKRQSKTNCGTVAPSCNDPVQIDYQPFPQTGQLASSMNQPLSALKQKLALEQDVVYCYVVSTIKRRDGRFYQTGSGPNFQGDLLTLCTCKHYMRAFMEPGEWVGKWVAGFSGVAAGEGRNVLVYLMKVGCAFDSHRTLWQELPDTVRQQKSSAVNSLGDLFQPKEPCGDKYDIRCYEPPHKDHSHMPNNNWHRDINYHRNRPAALLVGDL